MIRMSAEKVISKALDEFKEDEDPDVLTVITDEK